MPSIVSVSLMWVPLQTVQHEGKDLCDGLLALALLRQRGGHVREKFDWLQIGGSLEKAAPLPCMVYNCRAGLVAPREALATSCPTTWLR